MYPEMRNSMKKILKIKNRFIVLSGILMFTLSAFALCKETMSVRAAIETDTTQSQSSELKLNMSKESGCYDDAFTLYIECDKAKAIYYTTDGSNPVTSSTRKEYMSGIEISDRKNDENVLSAAEPSLFDAAYAVYDSKSKTFTDSQTAPSKDEVDKASVIKATAVDDKGLYTDVVTNTYFIGDMTKHIEGIKESCEKAGVTLSVMSISMDYSDLFDYEKGIYVKGKIFDDALAAYTGNIGWNAANVARGLDANYKQRGSDWERSAHIDYLESDGNTTRCLYKQDCGIRIQGNYSRSDLQKGFRLIAKKKYGKETFEYQFFGEDSKDDNGNTVSKFKKLVLRNGGNGAFLTKYADQYWQSLFKQLKCETQASRACVVYLNGEYWGIYILQEDYCDDYFETKHGVSKDKVVMYKGDAERYETGYILEEGKLPKGVDDESYYLNDLYNFFNTHKDLKQTKDYEEFSKIIDIENFKKYFAAQIWINNKWDWPGKNWSMWKTKDKDETNEYADGRWRLCVYDLDFGGISGKSSASDNTIKEDNYKDLGLLDMDTENPVVLSFAYLMTNNGFRTDFEKYLKEIDGTVFEKNNAVTLCEKYQGIYEPLYRQFFARYFGSSKAEKYKKEAKSGGYGSYKCIIAFIKERSKYIDNMITWVNEQYSDDADEETVTGRTFSKFNVVAKKGSKNIKISTGTNKTNVKITINKKIILKSKKKVNSLMVKTSKNGTVTVKLSQKLKRNMKITVKITKDGYHTKQKKITVK